MLRSYDKFDKAELRVIRNWQIGVITCYLAVFFGLLVLVALNHEVGAWTARATQADMTASNARPASAPTRITSFEINAPYP